ncbi:PilZ domain-containing protein [Hahella sp. CR1]|uniref:PilZ domain-containing protein n=1 Tax=Hahella sp. CR1 TaxID=2992807 RepID=UPI00244157C2|nr:PilZ domain-containing protein [Hahella sp. CR1]MDG9667358.1 PilZ domain-containing protein [Hahella sp. CR1]
MSDSDATSDNRRDYYRIHDQALVEYQERTASNHSMAEFYRHPVYFEMLNELQSLDLETSKLMGHVAEKDRSLAALLKALNKKVDLIARTLALVETDINEDRLQFIDLSEGGMAFVSPRQERAGQQLILKATLVPSYISILTEAEVVSSESVREHPEHVLSHEQENGDGFITRVNFINFSESQRQIVARHILRTQQQQRRRQLE